MDNQIQESEQSKIKLRKALERDCESIFHWRNHSETRRFFLNPEEISWESHINWFRSVLKDDSRYLFIAEDSQGKSLGVIRFDLSNQGKIAETDIYVVPDLVKQGIGKKILRLGLDWLQQNTQVNFVRASVMFDNIASLKLFSAAKFRPLYQVLELPLKETVSS